MQQKRLTRYLKPSKRTIRVKDEQYTQYTITTTVPEEWRMGVKVTIEPIKGLKNAFQLAEIRRTERELAKNHFLRELVEEKLVEDMEEANRLEQMLKASGGFTHWMDFVVRVKSLGLNFTEEEIIKLWRRLTEKGILVKGADDVWRFKGRD